MANCDDILLKPLEKSVLFLRFFEQMSGLRSNHDRRNTVYPVTKLQDATRRGLSGDGISNFENKIVQPNPNSL